METKLKVCGQWQIECRDKNGKLKWSDNFHNLVVNEGLQKLLDDTLLGGTPTPTWYVGLTDSAPVVDPTDTLTTHAGWTEFISYVDNRKPYVGVRADQTVSNTASRAVFTISGVGGIVGGCMLTSAETGTTGVLFAVGAFSEGDRPVIVDDVLNVTYNITQEAV